ncbi:hypothetical protein K469DRAFT_687789 [Zopfia rhizophila CBS 207.26]|uniref:Uncharacterized protein n=1 Tax=Zopfia rhizophila CBS 207.26 TaxID=1314779 RepID=A0A6A6E6C4_9PEZI|nr:hypothetical protein K469DRAFT_687789 [Zopfia rhizophila CBS 207.26]
MVYPPHGVPTTAWCTPYNVVYPSQHGVPPTAWCTHHSMVYPPQHGVPTNSTGHPPQHWAPTAWGTHHSTGHPPQHWAPTTWDHGMGYPPPGGYPAKRPPSGGYPAKQTETQLTSWRWRNKQFYAKTTPDALGGDVRTIGRTGMVITTQSGWGIRDKTGGQRFLLMPEAS